MVGIFPWNIPKIIPPVHHSWLNPPHFFQLYLHDVHFLSAHTKLVISLVSWYRRSPSFMVQDNVFLIFGWTVYAVRKKKAYVRLTQDYDALDVANRIGIIWVGRWSLRPRDTRVGSWKSCCFCPWRFSLTRIIYIMGNSWNLTKMLILVFVELFLFLGEWGFRVVVDFVDG